MNFKEIWKTQKNNILFFSFSILLMIVIIIVGSNNRSLYDSPPNEEYRFEKGTVVEVVEEMIETFAENQKKGMQYVKVYIRTGDYKGETFEITNYLSVGNSIYVKEGQAVIVRIDQSFEDSYMAGIYNYDRSVPLYICIGLLFFLLILIGGTKGFRASFGLIFTFVVIIFMMLPLVGHGMNAVPASIISIIPIIIIVLISISGFTKKTLVAIISTTIGVILSGVIFACMSGVMHISGYNSMEIDSLFVLVSETKFKLKDVLFAGVLISTLGAMMDIAVSIASSVAEIHYLNNNITRKQLLKSGFMIGRDITGTMSNTLILAFTGSFFTTLILFWSYRSQMNFVMNADSIVIEISQGLAGTIAMVLTVPLTAYIASRIYLPNKRKKD